MNSSAMHNAYPDSLGGALTDIAALLDKKKYRERSAPFNSAQHVHHRPGSGLFRDQLRSGAAADRF